MGGSSVRPQDRQKKHRPTRREQDAERANALTAANLDLLLFTTTWREFRGRADRPLIDFGMAQLEKIDVALAHHHDSTQARRVVALLKTTLNTEGFSPAAHNHLVVLGGALRRLHLAEPPTPWQCHACGSLTWKLAPEVVTGLETGRRVRTCAACGLVDADAEKRRR